MNSHYGYPLSLWESDQTGEQTTCQNVEICTDLGAIPLTYPRPLPITSVTMQVGYCSAWKLAVLHPSWIILWGPAYCGYLGYFLIVSFYYYTNFAFHSHNLLFVFVATQGNFCLFLWPQNTFFDIFKANVKFWRRKFFWSRIMFF